MTDYLSCVYNVGVNSLYGSTHCKIMAYNTLLKSVLYAIILQCVEPYNLENVLRCEKSGTFSSKKFPEKLKR